MKKFVKVNRANEAVEVARNILIDKHKEHFIGLYLSATNNLKKAELISLGTIDSAMVHPRESFRPALIYRASRVIFLHNHPSGETEASAADLTLFSRLNEAGRIMGIEVVDHLIFSSKGEYRSYH